MGWLRGGGVEDTVKMLTHKFAGVGSMEDYYAADTGAQPLKPCAGQSGKFWKESGLIL